jgi:hypothetical protein
MIGEYLIRIQQFLILLWYFLTFKPVVEAAIEEELTVARETLAQRLRKRWEHSKERGRQRQQKAA